MSIIARTRATPLNKAAIMVDFPRLVAQTFLVVLNCSSSRNTEIGEFLQVISNAGFY